MLGTGVLGGLDSLHILAHAQCETGDLGHEILEIFVAGNEVGLGIHLDHGSDLRAGGDTHETLGGDAPALLRGGG